MTMNRATILLATAAAAGGALIYGNVLVHAGVEGTTPAAMLAVLVSAAVSSVAGFAFSAICGAILLHLVDSPVASVQIMLVCSIGIQSLGIWMLRHQVEWAMLPRLLLGGLLGLPAGLWLLLHLSRSSYAGFLGALLVLYGTWMLLRRAPASWHAPSGSGVLARLVGGVTGGMAALPGPSVTIWCNLQGWSKTRQRGLTQPFILVIQLCTLGALYACRPGALPTLLGVSAWAYLPSAWTGTWIGMSAFRHLSDRQFTTAVNLLLIVSGIGLVL